MGHECPAFERFEPRQCAVPQLDLSTSTLRSTSGAQLASERGEAGGVGSRAVTPVLRCTPAPSLPLRYTALGFLMATGFPSLLWIPHQVLLSKPSTGWAAALVLFLWQQPGSFAVTSVSAKRGSGVRKVEPGTSGCTAVRGLHTQAACFLVPARPSSPCPGPVGEEAR